MAFQTAFGITPDGRVGRTTKTALGGLSFSDSTGNVLSVGSTGSAVIELQNLLKEKGYDAGPSDGVFGSSTLTAVIAFQKDQKLWVDGLVGPATMKALQNAPVVGDPGDDPTDDSHTDIVGTLSVGSRGSGVTALQTLLTDRGYDPGPSDGIFGEMTRKAVVEFQTDQGLVGDGIVGAATAGALGDAPASGSDSGAGSEILSTGSRGAGVVVLQHRLGDEGYRVGPHDGIFGPLTHAAVIQFQRDQNLSVDGKVGPLTRGALGIL
jgi:peptidoglycan hydrolase-like protein with peptidoglycan-binding domain